MKKILIVDYSINALGGVERTLCTLANNLSREHNVTVLSELRLSEKPFYNYRQNIKKYYLFGFLNSNAPKLIQRVYKKLVLKYKIRGFLSQYRDADVIIFGRVFVALHFLPILKKYQSNAKVIVRDAIHIYDFKDSTKTKMKKYFPSMVDTFIVSSDESIETYKKFFNSDKVHIRKLYNPLGIQPVIKYSPRNKTVVSIGRMDDTQKGFDSLVKAFAATHKKHPDWKLKLYGNGAQKQFIAGLIESLGAKDYISILSPTKDVVEVLNKSSIFVLASRYEGYANILVEALACGVPSISYDWLMGADEIIKNGENGIIVPLKDRATYLNGEPDNIDYVNLSNAIDKLIENPQLMAKYHKNGPEIIHTRSMEQIIKQWRAIIDEK